MRNLHFISLILVIVGALNWGLVGIAEFNLVSAIFGSTLITKVIYTIVGLAGLNLIFTSFGNTPKVVV